VTTKPFRSTSNADIDFLDNKSKPKFTTMYALNENLH